MVDDGRSQHSAQSGGNGQDRFLKRGEFSGDKLALELQSYAKEEDDHQQVADKQLQALQVDRHEVGYVFDHLPVFQCFLHVFAQVEGQRLVPHGIVRIGRDVRPDKCCYRSEKQQSAGKGRSGENASEFFQFHSHNFRYLLSLFFLFLFLLPFCAPASLSSLFSSLFSPHLCSFPSARGIPKQGTFGRERARKSYSIFSKSFPMSRRQYAPSKWIRSTLA